MKTYSILTPLLFENGILGDMPVFPSRGDEGGVPFGYFSVSAPVSHKSGYPFFIPDFAEEFRLYPAVALKICKMGKGVAPRFAYRYLGEAAPAFIILATDLLRSLRREGLPWDCATSFDRNFLLGNFQPLESFNSYGGMSLRMEDGEGASFKETTLPLPELEADKLLSLLSRATTIRTGDTLLIPCGGLTPPLAPYQTISFRMASDEFPSLTMRTR